MSATGDVLNQVVPALVRLARRPGAALLLMASVAVGAFAVLGMVHGLTGDDAAAWVPLGLAAVLAVPVATLAVRRHRLQVRTEGLDARETISGNPGVLVRQDDPARTALDEDLETFSAAMAESTLRTARFLPRVEAAQRAARLAAGGTVQAPYLKDDIRITFVALLATLAAVPLGTLGTIVTAILLLSR
jgi:hypothetical protein